MTWVDAGVQHLLLYLDRAALANETLAVFTADHGESPKYSCLPGGLRVPLVFRWPGVLQLEGTPRQQMVSHLDLLPTLLSSVQPRSNQERQVALAVDRRVRTAFRDLVGGYDLLPLLSSAHGSETRQPLRRFVPCATYFDRGIISDWESTLIWRSLEPNRLLGPSSAKETIVRTTQPISW